MHVLESSGGGVIVGQSVEEFAAATLDLLRDPARARRMGAAGREWVGRHRLFDALAAAIEPGYERLLAGGTPAERRAAGTTGSWVS